jgi:hypothetical protein
MPNRRPQLRLVTPASPEEAAAVIAAVERFLRDHAAPPASARPGVDAWTRAARLEGVRAGAPRTGPEPWGETHPW